MSWAREALRQHGMRARVLALSSSPLADCCCRARAPPLKVTSLARRYSTQASTEKPYFVTTPIFYVNADPHIGHLHSDIVADVLARWHQWRWRGRSPAHGSPQTEDSDIKALLSTGTDEHGLKIQKVAEGLGVKPQELCDRVSQRFKALADAANISYTSFIRTTDDDHKEAVKHLWKRLEERGYIYKGRHAGWYAVSDEAFYPEGQIKDVKDSKTGESYKVSIETGQRVEWAEEENYKFKLSEMAPQLLEWLSRNPAPIQPLPYHRQIVAEVSAGLQDLSISRPSNRLYWGVEVPRDASQCIYVWVDALTNYLTVTGYPWENGGQSAWPADTHVVGKDILRFHAIYWPALLMAAGLPPPHTVLSHAHWTKDRSKMSKSKGNVVDPFKALEVFGVDTLRCFLMRVGGNFATDSDYTQKGLLEFHRKFLQGQLGNLLSRVTAPKILSKLAEANSADAIVLSRPKDAQVSKNLVHSLSVLPRTVDEHISNYELAKALEAIFDAIGAANELTSTLEPWSAAASKEDITRAVYFTAETLRISALLLRPFMPAKMQEMLSSLYAEGDQLSQQRWEDSLHLREHIRLPFSGKKVKPLFPKLEVTEEV